MNSPGPTRQLIEAYFDAFNRHDSEGLLALLDDNVVHDINEGSTEIGLEAFRNFKAHMDRCYREQIQDLRIMIDGDLGCAEFQCDGVYLETDPGLPEATGQTYSIPGCAIFEIRLGRIHRITSYYNLMRWRKQVEGHPERTC